MPDRPRVIAIAPARDEQSRIGLVVSRVMHGAARDVVDKVIVVDDASIDATANTARARGAEVVSHAAPRGVGAAIRTGMELAVREGFDIAVILAGNNKDEPDEIPQLIRPIVEHGADFVMGSRYLEGGRWAGAMPLYRRLATRLHPWLVSLLTGMRITESTNGFRAIRLSILSDPRIRLNQSWLDTYGLEVYLLWKALTLNYRHCEVPCTKTYPERRKEYTKMKPIVDWWSILRPVFLLGFGLRR